MENLESFFKKILNNIKHEGCLLKNEQILHANAPFLNSMDEHDVTSFLKSRNDKEYEWTYRSKSMFYTLKRIIFDEVYSLILLTKTSDSNLIVDPLTGALNRECFDRLSHQLLKETKALENVLAFLFIDLDEFKSVNDTWGHENGDVVLKTTAERISNIIRTDDFCFRIGGDEFMVILTSIKEKMHSCLVARRLISAISEPVYITSTKDVKIGASIGIASYPSDGCEVDELTSKADEAMYRAKKMGKNNYQLSTTYN